MTAAVQRWVDAFDARGARLLALPEDARRRAIARFASLGFPTQRDEDWKYTSVAAIAGTSFGAEGEGYLRFSYANSVENIREAMGRIRACLAKAA